jgi:hypothetical protein
MPRLDNEVPSLNTTLNGALPVRVSVNETVPPLQIEPPPLIAAVGLLFTVVIVTVPILSMAEASQLSTSTMSLMEYMVGLVGVTVMV